MSDVLDRRAILHGALACLVVAAPAVILLAVLDESDEGQESNWVLAVLVVIVAAYFWGGARAGRLAHRAPFLNGAIATLSVFVAVQGVALIVSAVDGDGVNGLALAFNALLAASIGVVGAWFGARRAA